MSAHHPKPPFWKVCAQGMVWMTLIWAATFVAERLGWLHGLEMAGLDSFVRQQDETLSDRIYVVKITDDDYQQFFNSTSPLNADKLGTLIHRILTGEPAVLGVDIDTSDRRFAPLADLARDARIVWARVPQRVPATPEEALAPLDSLVGIMGSTPGPGVRFGVPLFPFEPDGAVRRYRRVYPVKPEGVVDSLPWAIVKSLPSSPPDGEEEVILNFRGGSTKFPAIGAKEFLTGSASGPDRERWKKMLHNQIVLLGGGYSAARDEYATAVGRMAGVDLIAHAVQGDLEHKAILEFSQVWGAVIDFAIGFTVVASFYFIPSLRVAFWVSLVGTTVMAVYGSQLAFRSATYWVNFVPMLVGMLAHQLIDHGERHRHLKRDLELAQAEVKKLTEKLASKTAGA
jgi:CHASE2 domain-containing sensor protein